MPAYAAAIPRPPRTLTDLEQATLLKVAGEHRAGFRDHVIFAVALGTGLREHEIAALNGRGRSCILVNSEMRRFPSS
jgi:integrase